MVDAQHLTGSGAELYLGFSVVTSGAWGRPWYSSNGVFGMTRDGEWGLNTYVVRVPLDLKAHVIALSSPCRT